MRDTFLFGTFDANDRTTYICTSFRQGTPQRTEAFKRHCRAGRSEDTFSGQRYVEDPAPSHTYAVSVQAATTTALETAIANLDAAIVAGETFYVQLAGSVATYYAKIRGVDRTDPMHEPGSSSGRVAAIVTYLIECDPGWTRTTGTAFSGTITNYPGYVEVTDIPGTMPAKTDLQVTCAQALTSLFVGYASNRVTATSGMQDYQGDATHAAKCRSGEAAKLTTMTSGWQGIGTADNLDSAAHEGWYAVIASLLQTDGTASDTSYRAVSRVTGSGIAETADFATHKDAATGVPATVASSAAFECVHLGDVPVPSAGVPAAGTSSGYGPEGVVASAETGTYSIPGGGQARDSSPLTLAPCLVTKLACYVHTAAAGEYQMHLYAYPAGAKTASATFTGTPAADAWLEVDVDAPVVAEGDYYVRIWPPDGSVIYGLATVPHYARARVYGQAPKGYNTTIRIEAKNAGGGSAFLDWSQIMPADEFFLSSYHSFSANQGVRVDSDLDDVLLTDSSDNRGFSLLYRSATDRTLVRGDSGLRPGTARIFACGGNSGTTGPGAIAISGTYWPKWEVLPGS